MVYNLLRAAATIPWPQETAYAAGGGPSDYWGWSPKPTPDPVPQLELLKRQDSDFRTCGYVEGNPDISLTCPGSLVCGTDAALGYGICCQPGNLAQCEPPTSCINYQQNELCDEVCQNDRRNVKCSDSSMPDCVRLFYDYATTVIVVWVCSTEGVDDVRAASFDGGPPISALPILPASTSESEPSSSTGEPDDDEVRDEDADPAGVSEDRTVNANGSNDSEIENETAASNANSNNNSDAASVNNNDGDDDPSTATDATDPNINTDTDTNSTTNVGAIAGGVVGGLAVFAGLFLGIFFLLLRHRRLNRSNNYPHPHHRRGKNGSSSTEAAIGNGDTPELKAELPTTPSSTSHRSNSPSAAEAGKTAPLVRTRQQQQQQHHHHYRNHYRHRDQGGWARGDAHSPGGQSDTISPVVEPRAAVVGSATGTVEAVEVP